MRKTTAMDRVFGRLELIRDLNAATKERDELQVICRRQRDDIRDLERKRRVSIDEANLNKEQIKNLLQEISRLQSLINGDSKADVGASSISPERINPNVLRGRSSLASDRSGQIGGASASTATTPDSTAEQMLLVAAAAAIASTPEPTYTPAPAPTPEPAHCAPTRSYEPSPSYGGGDSGYSGGDSGGGGGD